METIQKYLAAKKITQTAFANQCNITPGRLSQILRGEDPSLSLIRVMERVSGGAIRANDFVNPTPHQLPERNKSTVASKQCL